MRSCLKRITYRERRYRWTRYCVPRLRGHFGCRSNSKWTHGPRYQRLSYQRVRNLREGTKRHKISHWLIWGIKANQARLRLRTWREELSPFLTEESSEVWWEHLFSIHRNLPFWECIILSIDPFVSVIRL